MPGPATVFDASWKVITGGDLAGDGTQDIYDVALTAAGTYVAIGLDGFAAVWTSPDALTWNRQPQGPEWNGAQLLQIETGPEGTLVAVGRRLGDPHVFAVWTSSDGLAWTEQPSATGTLPGGTQQVLDLEAYPGGYVAVGSVQDGSGEIDAAWWISTDGVTWTAHTISEPGVQQMLGVAVGNGTMVAAGWHGSSTGVWRAPIGGEFSRVDDIELTIEVSDRDPTFADARVFAWDVAATGYGFVAVGADQTSPHVSYAAAWTSPDGIGWTRYGNETGWMPNMANAGFSGTGPWTVMDTVLESNGTTIVIGRTNQGNEADLAVWETTDGHTWVQGPVGIRPEHQRVRRALAVNGRLIAVGGTGPTPNQLHGAVWVATVPPGPTLSTRDGWTRAQVLAGQWKAGLLRVVEFGGQGLATANVRRGINAWSSTDGTSWNRLDPPGLQDWDDFAYNLVVAGGRAFMVGSDADGAAIWQSTDGVVWAMVSRPESVGGTVRDLIEVDGRYFATGPSSVTPILWTSQNGTDWVVAGLPPDTAIEPRALTRWGSGAAILVAYDSATDAPALWPLDPREGLMARIPATPELAGFSPWLATTLNDRLVLVGTEPGATQLLVAAHTSDLQDWTRIVICPCDVLVSDLQSTGEGVIVAGRLMSNSRSWVWTSRELEFWTAAPVEPESQSSIRSAGQSVAIIDGRLVIGGWVEDEGTNRYTVWLLR